MGSVYPNRSTGRLWAVVTCAPCNYARVDCTLEEAMLSDPRERQPIQSLWDGLERFSSCRLHDYNLCQ
jgi:hypothetical protein